jgi:hypothetical protein
MTVFRPLLLSGKKRQPRSKSTALTVGAESPVAGTQWKEGAEVPLPELLGIENKFEQWPTLAEK